jgi:putative peptide zinc metalloprotease protein
MQRDISQACVPGLREDLRLHSGPDDQSWIVYDPIAHRYHEVDRLGFDLMALWCPGMTYGDLAHRMEQQTGASVSAKDVLRLAETMDALGFLREPLHGWKSVHEKQQKHRQSLGTWVLHNYLFIRVPLVNPDSFLQRTLPVARLVASWPALLAILLFGLTGLYLASRQWDAFTHTFLHFLSLEGLAGYFTALVGVKLLHELGHAYAAKHFGCRVPSMGIAFMILAPMAYTDVTDAWRLPDRRARMVISAAGVVVELGVAMVATFLWSLLPEGTLKSAAFFVAAISWVMSLAVNLSPLMRFDGYYLLSDLWRIPNLQSRSFALMRWWLRERLFDLRAECPEDWTSAMRAKVLIYAVCATTYRLVLFIGIAVFIYHTTLKILGIALFLIEISWFIARPVAHELAVWWRLRNEIRTRNRYRVSISSAAVAMTLIAIPWPHRVELPAVLEAKSIQRLTTPIGAQIKEVALATGKTVKAGEVLVVMTAPKLDADIQKIETQLQLARLRYARRTADAQDRDATNVLERDISGLVNRLSGLVQIRDELTVRAQLDGVISDTMPDLHPGRWVARGEELAMISAPQVQVRGYIPEPLINAVARGSSGVFVSDIPRSSIIRVSGAAIAPTNAPIVDIPYLTSSNGGAISVNEDRERGAVPLEAQFQVTLDVEDGKASPVTQRGVVLVEATPESFFSRIGKRALAILIRESGF